MCCQKQFTPEQGQGNQPAGTECQRLPGLSHEGKIVDLALLINYTLDRGMTE